MSPAVRRMLLTLHVACSVGWLGAVASFLAVAVAGRASDDVEVVRGAFLSMDVMGRYAIVPLSLAAIATGVVQALATPWGLFRHWWVLMKLVLGLVTTLLLLLHQFTAVSGAASRVRSTAPGVLPDVRDHGTQLVADAAGGIAVLLVIVALSIYKPWGRTPWARPPAGGVPMSTPTEPAGLPTGLKVLLAVLGLIVLVFLGVHLAGGGLGHHGP